MAGELHCRAAAAVAHGAVVSSDERAARGLNVVGCQLFHVECGHNLAGAICTHHESTHGKSTLGGRGYRTRKRGYRTVCGIQLANDASIGALPLGSNRRLRLIGGTVRDGGAAFVGGAKSSKGHSVRRAVSRSVELHNTPAISSRCQQAKQKHGGGNTSQARITTPTGSHSLKPVSNSCEIIESKDARRSSGALQRACSRFFFCGSPL